MCAGSVYSGRERKTAAVHGVLRLGAQLLSLQLHRTRRGAGSQHQQTVNPAGEATGTGVLH